MLAYFLVCMLSSIMKTLTFLFNNLITQRFFDIQVTFILVLSNKGKHCGCIIVPTEPERQADLDPTSDMAATYTIDREEGFIPWSRLLVFSNPLP